MLKRMCPESFAVHLKIEDESSKQVGLTVFPRVISKSFGEIDKSEIKEKLLFLENFHLIYDEETNIVNKIEFCELVTE